MSAEDRLARDRLVDEAIERAGSTDFGEDTWQEGLDLLVEGFVTEAGLNQIGVEVAAEQIVGNLATRGAITAWRADHPAVADESIEAPIVIVGQPRTGTTILHDLMALDPALRAPLTWEVDRPVPPPGPETDEPDPRIADVQAGLDMTETLRPGFTAFHPMGATLAQECVRMTASDFRSMLFSVTFRVPTYNRWLLHDADMAPAYRWHRRYLQHLQSGRPTPRWLLKSPAHLWSLPDLLAEYPDAVIVQTHRDPLKVIASVSALAAHLRRLAADDPTVTDAATQYADDIVVGLDRGDRARDDGTLAADRVVDVHFADFMDDPIVTIDGIYRQAGLDLTAETESRMRAFLAANPGDVGGGRYSFADTDLDADELRERTAAYAERHGVRLEPIT